MFNLVDGFLSLMYLILRLFILLGFYYLMLGLKVVEFVFMNFFLVNGDWVIRMLSLVWFNFNFSLSDL